MRYMDELTERLRSEAEIVEAITLHVHSLGALIDAVDALTGQGASTYSSVTFGVRDVYHELRSKRRIHV